MVEVTQADIDAAREYMEGEVCLARLFAAHREAGRRAGLEEAADLIKTTRTLEAHGPHCGCITCQMNQDEDAIRDMIGDGHE